MRKIRNIDEAVAVLAQYITPQKTKYTLDNMHHLMDYLNNPQNGLRVIHVAGTSGKTSTSYYIASILKNAGYTVGLTVSPHIVSVSDRIQVDLIPLDDQTFCTLLTEFLVLVDESAVVPSYFELLIAFAYWVFAKLHVDYAVIEVGLGGLLDATNVIDTEDKVCIITDVGFDHVEILGDTLDKIADQKAGIIHTGNTVLLHTQAEEVLKAVEDRCSAVNAHLTVIEEEDLELPLPAFQNRNLHLAKATCDVVLERNHATRVSADNIAKASTILIPVRMEQFTVDNKVIILDGAHNAQKIHMLTVSMEKQFPGKQINILASFGRNKASSIHENIEYLHTISDFITFSMFDFGQDEFRVAMDNKDLAVIARDIGFKEVYTYSNYSEALGAFLQQRADVYLITGSFYFVSQLRPILLKLS